MKLNVYVIEIMVFSLWFLFLHNIDRYNIEIGYFIFNLSVFRSIIEAKRKIRNIHINHQICINKQYYIRYSLHSMPGTMLQQTLLKSCSQTVEIKTKYNLMNKTLYGIH